MPDVGHEAHDIVVALDEPPENAAGIQTAAVGKTDLKMSIGLNRAV